MAQPPRSGSFFDKQLPGSTELLTIAETAKLLGVSVSGMRRLHQERKIPFFKIGRRVRFAPNDIAAYLEQRRIESVS